MINRIKLKNFRSIISADVEFQDFSVFVGANATGKSNIIKGIEFFSDIVKLGVVDALYRRGGYKEVIPKSSSKTYGVPIDLSVSLTLGSPLNWELFDLPELTVQFDVTIVQTMKKRVRITKESVTFKHCLLSSKFLSSGGESIKEPEDLQNITFDDFYNTDITLFRKRNNKIGYRFDFELTPDNKILLLKWMGVEKLIKMNSKQDEFEIKDDDMDRIFYQSINSTSSADVNLEQELILSQKRLLDSFCLHFQNTIYEIGSIGKYDLLINELRQEQNISNSLRVDSFGKNIPSITKRLSKIDSKEILDSIISTMSNISPYFKSASSKSLRAGKEYIEFTEIFGGKGIESWESSDGTLRAFAILLALETHQIGSTLMIEEPEHGLHPWAIKDLINHIREVINRKDIQVIITTHSQQVLECIAQDELIISERDSNGTKFNKIKDIFPDTDVNMGEIGELWVRGLLRGVPTTI